MKITIEAQVLNHDRRSGLMTYTEGLINSINLNDCENKYDLVYYSLTKGKEHMPGPWTGNIRKNVLKIPDREFWKRQWLIDHLFLPAFLKSRNVNVFHRPNGYTIPSCKNIFKILTIHDLRTLAVGDQVWKQDIENYKKSLAMVDMCVVVSECTKNDLLQHMRVDERKIKVIYLGVDQRFKPAPTDQIRQVREKFGLKEEFLLSIGSVPRKNIDGIIKGYAGCKYAKDFLLVLSCNQDIVKYKTLSSELGVGDRVIILDKLTDEDVVALYSACYCFVFPSLYEGFGLPILEAMQCGAPVITSNMSSCPEVSGDAAILINPKKTSDISMAINSICGDLSLRKSLIEKGFNQSKLFSWENYWKEIKKIYDMA